MSWIKLVSIATTTKSFKWWALQNKQIIVNPKGAVYVLFLEGVSSVRAWQRTEVKLELKRQESLQYGWSCSYTAKQERLFIAAVK